MLTTHELVIPAVIARPAYLARVPEPGFGTTLQRITGDTGTPFPIGDGDAWGLDSRHGYSRRYPWSLPATGLPKFAYFEQRNGTPSKFVVRCSDWAPIVSNLTSKLLNSCTEVRWMPGRESEMIGLSGQSLVIFDVLENREIRRIPLPSIAGGIGLIGEGNLSNDGTVLALGNTAFDVVLVDVLNGRVGPAHKLTEGWPADSGPLDNLTVSPLSSVDGGKLVVKATHGRVYDFDIDLKLTPRRLDPWGLRMAGAKAASFGDAGMIGIQSHADVGLTPAGVEVFVGGIRDQSGDVNLKGSGLPSHIKPFSKNDGRIVAFDIASGIHTHISIGTNFLRLEDATEAYDQHCSCRGPDGWVLTTYAGQHESTGRFHGELVLWKLDGSLECVRFGVTRTHEDPALNPKLRYRCEAHGVARKDGRAVMHASNDQWDTIDPGDPADVKCYVHTLSDDVIDPPPPPVVKPYRAMPMTADHGIVDSRGFLVHPKDVESMLNRLWRIDHP